MNLLAACMIKKYFALVALTLAVLVSQQEAANAKKSRHKIQKPAPIETMESDPTPIESITIAMPVPQSSFAVVPDSGCRAGKMKVDLDAKNFNFVAYLSSQQSTAADAIP
jgi:hypothetical protein